MSKNYCPFLYGKFRKFFRMTALAVTLGVAACSGSSEQQSDEVVDVDSADSMDTASNDEGSGLIIEQETPDETGNDVPLVEDSGMGDTQETVAEEEPAPADDTAAVPDEIMAESTSEPTETPESIDATLTDSQDSSLDEAIAAQPVQETSDDEISNISFGEPEATVVDNTSFGQSSGVLPPGVVASPGAAIFIKSKYEKSSGSKAWSSAGSSSGSNSYVVVPGDTISGISKKLFGSFAKTQELASLNNISAPYVIQPGEVIKYNGGASYASSGDMQTVKVKHGDTLSKLAGELFGNTGAWKVLYNMNKAKISNPNFIRPGMVLAYSGNGAVKPGKTAKLKKSPAKKSVQTVKAPVKKEAPQAEAAPVETPVEETVTEAPVPDMNANDSPMVEESDDEIINVDLPTDDEE